MLAMIGVKGEPIEVPNICWYIDSLEGEKGRTKADVRATFYFLRWKLKPFLREFCENVGFTHYEF